MTKIGLIQFLLLFLISAAWGQKVKYKDIYALLSTKQFEQAEPFLKNYLKENIDNPNAYLYMGHIFQEKASKNDVLKQTATAIANMDSAILFYGKATAMIDDRELRKNKEYYQTYNRRDLRTGEFGVKLSDVQFDISKKVEVLKERIANVKMVKHYFALADTAYQRSNALFVSLQKKFPSTNQLYLRADEQTRKDLATLAMRFDSCVKAFEHYKVASSSVGKTGYNQEISLKAIADFKKQGADGADFFQDDVQLWNYKEFADNALAVIEKEILPMRENLLAYDAEINKLREKLGADSVSVRNDLTKLIDKLLYEQLRKFDPEPLPMLVFGLKTTELEYRSLTLEHKPSRDSANIPLHIGMLSDELQLLGKIDSTATFLRADRLADQALDYAGFISDAYGSVSALTEYIESLREFALVEQEKKRAHLGAYMKALNYIVDGADSIPLLPDSASTWRPLVTIPDKYTIGISVADSAKVAAYFYTITPARTADVKALFPLDNKLFNPGGVSSTGALAHVDAGGQIYYVLLYSAESVDEKFPATLAKIYRSDGLAWKKDLPLPFTPMVMNLAADTGVVIRSETQEMVVDKNGKVVR